MSVTRVVLMMAYSRKVSMVSMTGFVRNLFTMRIDLTCSTFGLSLFEKVGADQSRGNPCERTERGCRDGGKESFRPAACKPMGTSSQSKQIHP